MQARFYWNPAARKRRGRARRSSATARRLKSTRPVPRRGRAWPRCTPHSARGSPGCFPTPRLRPRPVPAPPERFPSIPTLADAHAALAYSALHYGWDSAAADASFRRAIALNQNCVTAFHWYSHALVAVRRFEESLAHSRAALQLDPMNLLIHVHLAWHHYMAREPGKTVEQAESVDSECGSHLPQGFRAAGLGTGGGGSACRSSRRSAGERSAQ